MGLKMDKQVSLSRAGRQTSFFVNSGKAQGSLEYLIIIAVVMAIVAVAVLFFSGAFSSAKTSTALADCRQAAAECKALKFNSPNDPCLRCNTACVDPVTRLEAGPNATVFCKQGKPENVTSG